MGINACILLLFLLHWVDVVSYFLKEMDPDRVAMSGLYADLADHPVFQNNLTSLPKAGTVDVEIALCPVQVGVENRVADTVYLCKKNILRPSIYF